MARSTSSNVGFSAIELLLVILVVAVLGLGAWFIYERRAASTNESGGDTIQRTTNEPEDPYAGWKTYMSEFEGMTFKYPADWTLNSVRSADGSDDAEVISPAGSFSVHWTSGIIGKGGWCDMNNLPSQEHSDACPYWYVTDKQRLRGAELYYVAGAVTYDGVHYKPWCTLQDNDGLLADASHPGVSILGFNSKKDPEYGTNLMCTSFSDESYGTKDEAIARLGTEEYKQAKLILLSASY